MRGQIPTILEESWNVGNVKSNKRIRVFLTYNSTISLKKLVRYKKCFEFVKINRKSKKETLTHGCIKVTIPRGDH